ncbi:ABATE domain-containing protein [Effusibacillus pohliae]|uniref:ABATE domain-containing protein n=1 Tax=Effusibacillus pohliae TaxID=232270 RepID=UPI00036554CC|nr:ABATE domain-containing protein [Effusibacillus pohliae]
MNATGQPLVEGNQAIDLVNTEEIRRGVRRDFIGSPEDFTMLLTNEELAGAVSKVQIPFEVKVWSSNEIEKVHKLRDEVREILEQAAEDEEVGLEFVGRLESYIEQAPLTLRLHGGG